VIYNDILRRYVIIKPSLLLSEQLMSNLQNLIKQFLDDLSRKNRSQQTLSNYAFYLNKFLLFSRLTEAEQINISVIKQFADYLASTSAGKINLAKATQNCHLIALRGLIKFLKSGGLQILPVKDVKLNHLKRKKNFLAETDMKKILELSSKSRSKEIIKLRDRAILELLFSTGLKVSELVNLKPGDLNLLQGQLIIRKKKPVRTIELTNQCLFWLKKYLAKHTDQTEYLFSSCDYARNKRPKPGSALSGRSVERLLEKYAWLSGFKGKVTPQAIRNLYAHNLLTSGQELKAVQLSLGHISINTTKTYQ
jgi:integrase/recombinase XerD